MISHLAGLKAPARVENLLKAVVGFHVRLARVQKTMHGSLVSVEVPGDRLEMSGSVGERR